MSDAFRCSVCEEPLRPDAFYCGSCGSAAVNAVYCGGCESLVPAEAFFCHRCGLKVRPGDPPVIAAAVVAAPVDGEAADVPAKGVTIEIDLSSGYEDELVEQSMRALPGFHLSGDPAGTRTARVTFTSAEVERMLSFAESVAWRAGRRVYRDGKAQDWDVFFDFVACYRERERSQGAVEYCFFDDANTPNPWGCFQLRLALDSSHEAADWLTLGHFERDGSFAFDKKRIVALLDQRSQPYRLCPALDVRRISTALKALPAKVNPQTDPDWKYIEDLAGDDPNAVTVHKRDGNEKVKVRIRGVAPASDAAAARIAKDLRKRMAEMTPIPPGKTPIPE